MTPHVLAPPPWTGPATAEESADGLQFAWLFPKEGPASPLNLAGVSAALDGEAGLVWIHLNATAVPAKHWLANCRHLPEPIREELLETDERTRLEPLGDAVLGAIGDVVAWADPDPWRLCTLRFYLHRRWLLTTRRRPANSASRLARSIRGGLAVRSSAELLVWLLTFASEGVQARTRELARETDRIEDEVLNGDIGPARRRLGKSRRRAAVLRRQVALRPRAIDRMRARLPLWLGEDDRYEVLDALDRIETLADELTAIEQREAALETEVGARLAEETNRNLYVLSIVTVLFAPMTLVTGVFGMNVAGLPGLESGAAFWWVLAGMTVAAVALLAAMYWRRLF